MKNYIGVLAFVLIHCAVFCQVETLPSKDLQDVEIKAIKTVNGIGRLGQFDNELVYAGKKNEIIIVDSINANKSVNNTRQIIGRIPGLNIVESETGGFASNGIGFRGLNPVQSIEVNVRQNGANIAADVYGYNESYYIPPMEAVERIELVRGASSLQFGPHFGGMVNYCLKKAPVAKKLELNASVTTGSFGLINGFLSFAGTYKKFSYYTYTQLRYFDGYRPNSNQTQLNSYAKVEYQVSKKVLLSLEYSLLRNKIKMPGGLSDSLFEANPRISLRTRNWLTTPWNIVTMNLSYKISQKSSYSIKVTYNRSGRNLVWRNEDGGASAIDVIDPITGLFSPRELGKQRANGLTSEMRFLSSYAIKRVQQTFAAGVTVAYSKFDKLGSNYGTRGSDYDFGTISPELSKDLHYTTFNVAGYIEHIFRIGSKLSVTPGARLEFLKSTSSGYKVADDKKEFANQVRTRVFPLIGVGLEYKIKDAINFYGNISQSYKAIDYSALTPLGVSAKIDQKMKDAYGWNADLGIRGTFKNYFNFDVNMFCMKYNRRIGVVLKKDENSGTAYLLRTNVANSLHVGFESYIELNLFKLLSKSQKIGQLSVFNSLAYINARYYSGEYRGKYVEYAPEVINRSGVTYSVMGFSTTVQLSGQTKAFGDASNAIASDNLAVGVIPAYMVLDWSCSYKIKFVTINGGLNNVSNRKYFTQRADEYPGPGIIPSIGRNFYLGISVKI